MKFTDILTEQAKQSQNSLIDVIDSSQASDGFLSDNAQGFADTISASLGLPAGSIKTDKDWEALNKSEAERLMNEEEAVVMDKVVTGAMRGEKAESFSRDLEGLARLDMGGIPDAASISANKEDFAVSDVRNPGNLLTPRDVALRQQRAVGKWQVMQQAAMEAEEEAKKTSTWNPVDKESGIRDFLSEGSGFEAYYDRKAVEVLGIALGELEDVVKFDKDMLIRLGRGVNASNYQEVFMRFMAYLQSRDDLSEVQLARAIEDIKAKWDRAGVTKRRQAKLLKAAADFSPALSTLNALALAPTVSNTAGFLGKAGVALKSGLYAGAIRNLGLAGVEATQIPFGGVLVDKLAMPGVRRGVRVFTPASDAAKTIEKAVKTNDRETIKLYAESLLGKPTDTDFMIKGSKTEGVLKYFIDPVVDAVDNPEKSLSNTQSAVLQKIRNSIRTRMEDFISRNEGFQRLSREYIGELWNSVSDTLDLNNAISAGRGRYGEKIMALTDLDSTLRSKDGDIVYAVKLVSDNDPVSAFMSTIKKDSKGNEYDAGRKAAEKLGKDLSDALNATDSDYRTSYTTDWVKLSEENGYWRPSLLINTHKGLGTLHYEHFKNTPGLMKQEKYRPLLSWLATVTSNPTHIRAADVMRDIEAGILKSTGEAAISSFKGLPRKSQEYAQALVDISTDYAAWYDPATLLAKGANAAEVETYMAFKMMNDIDEFVRNKNMRLDLVSKGCKSGWFNGVKIPGVVRPVPEIHSASDMIAKVKDKRVLVDAIEGVPHALTDEKVIADYYRKGYILVEPSLSPEATVSAHSFYYLLNPQSTNFNDLGAFVTTYVAGGRRFFRRGSNYVKQLVMGSTENGRRTVTGVQTFFTDVDTTGLAERTAVLEEARKLYITGKKDECTRLIQSQGWQKAPFNDAESFHDFFAGMGMDFDNIDNPLEVVQDGRVLNSYAEIIKKGNVDDLVGIDDMKEFAKNSKYQAISNEAKVQKMKRSGRELLTWDFEKAQTVDFEQQMRYLVNDMVEAEVMGQYTDYVADHFAKVFDSVIDKRGGVEMTPREMLISGNVKKGLKGTDAELAEQAITAQKNYSAIRGIPTDVDRKAAQMFTGVIEGVFGKIGDFLPKSLESVKHGVRVKWNEWKAEANPLQFIRTFAAHKVLGFFNPQQFIRQAAQDISIQMMDSYAVTCAADAARVEAIMIRSGGDIVKAKQFAQEAFKGNKELLNNALNIIDMGLFEHGTAGGFLERSQTVKNMWNQLSFLPFNLGEMHPRVLSGLTALKRKGLYGVRASYKDLVDPSMYARSLFMNMDATGVSRLQNSQIAATILQFQTPTFRWFETLFDPNLTKWQRLKLGIGTSLLVGGEGLVGVGAYNTISNNVYRIFHDDRTDDLPSAKDTSEILQIFRRGLLNQYLSEYAGNVNLAGPWEINAMELIDLFTGVVDLDVKDVASVQAVTAMFKGGGEIYTGLKALLSGRGTEADLRAFLESFPRYLPSSISKPWMAYNVYRTGEILNTKGELTERTNSMLVPVLMALGFNRLTPKEIAKAYAENRYRADILKNFEDELYKAMVRWSRYKSPESWDTVQTVIKSFNAYPEEKGAVLNRVWKRLPSAFTERLGYLELQQLLKSGMSGDNLIK